MWLVRILTQSLNGRTSKDGYHGQIIWIIEVSVTLPADIVRFEMLFISEVAEEHNPAFVINRRITAVSCMLC